MALKNQEKTSGLFTGTVPINIIFPVAWTVVLFVLTIFLLILPRFEAKLMDGKREVIRELTESALSALRGFEQKERDGELSREAAQALAVEYLRLLRYGPENKDYFWINDMHPNLVMHPYRTDLEGKDISGFADPNGKLLFVECVRTVKKRGQGYVDYQWQWKDDPERIVPKISFVKIFRPWGWVVGTGIYVEDVRAEIASITRKLTFTCLGILAIIMGLSFYIVWHTAQVEKKKKAAEERARMQQEQLFQAAKLASVGELVSGVAHEINNPITSIMLNAPIVEKIWKQAGPILDEHCKTHGDFLVGRMSYSRLSERMPTLLADIVDGATRVKNIVRDLKDFARETPPDMSDNVDANQVVKKSAALVANLIKKATDNFNVNYRDDLPLFKGNTQRIEQVVVNLLVNACHAIPEKIRALDVATEYESEWVIIEIRDQGVGMSKDTIRKIRDPFFTTKREQGGTGLGLAISDRIVRDHGGRMEFESEPGLGTTVRVFFPVKL